MGTRIALPLRVLLPCLVVGLAASGAAAVGVAMAAATGGYLTRQADDHLLACTADLLSPGLVAAPGSVSLSGQLLPGSCRIELMSATGQVLVPGPAGAGAGRRWRVVITAVRYRPRRIPYVYGPDDMVYAISGPAGRGLAGRAVVMTGLAGIGRVMAGYAAAAGAVLVLLAGAALAVSRIIWRPLRRAAGFAGSAALRENSAQFRAAEAAARRSADEVSTRLAEVSLALRTPVNVVRGFAQCCRQRGAPSPACLDRMMRRIADDAARMDALIRKLEETMKA